MRKKMRTSGKHAKEKNLRGQKWHQLTKFKEIMSSNQEIMRKMSGGKKSKLSKNWKELQKKQQQRSKTCAKKRQKCTKMQAGKFWKKMRKKMWSTSSRDLANPFVPACHWENWRVNIIRFFLSFSGHFQHFLFSFPTFFHFYHFGLKRHARGRRKLTRVEKYIKNEFTFCQKKHLTCNFLSLSL